MLSTLKISLGPAAHSAKIINIVPSRQPLYVLLSDVAYILMLLISANGKIIRGKEIRLCCAGVNINRVGLGAFTLYPQCQGKMIHALAALQK